VDEYQDTKDIQYTILTSILKVAKGISKTFIVGDPNQSIYHNLGGYPIPAAEFKERANLEILHEMQLSKNYRSSDRIIGYFGNFNVHNTNIQASSKDRAEHGLISFDQTITEEHLTNKVVRLIQDSISQGIEPSEICILAPQWVFLGKMTRSLMSNLPEYRFDGPGMVPFSRDVDNFWYKLTRIVLTQSTPDMYVRRLRWAGEVLQEIENTGGNIAEMTARLFLRKCNSIIINENDGLVYLRRFFEELFLKLQIDFQALPQLQLDHQGFFESSQARIERLIKEGSSFMSEIGAYKRVFEYRQGIKVSTIHGIKGDEYDTVIGYGLLEDLVPHFSDQNKTNSAKKLLYVLCSRARKYLHLISERRVKKSFRLNEEYHTTKVLADCYFVYDSVI
jgi:superfamily I DNA/RNA helicase